MEALNQVNSQVLVDRLPSINDVDYESLHLDYRKINVITTALLFVVLLLAILGLFYFNDNFQDNTFWQVGLLLWLIGSSFFLFRAIKSFDFMGYALRERDIIFKSGIWFRSIVIVPFNRVQHCEIEQGPIDRYFGLATLSLYTAGGSSSDLSIHGLPLAVANGMKSFITQKIASVDEEE